MLAAIALAAASLAEADPTHIDFYTAQGCTSTVNGNASVIDRTINLPTASFFKSASVAVYENVIALYPQSAALAADAQSVLKEYHQKYNGAAREAANITAFAKKCTELGQFTSQQCNLPQSVSTCGQCTTFPNNQGSFRFSCPTETALGPGDIAAITTGSLSAVFIIVIIVLACRQGQSEELSVAKPPRYTPVATTASTSGKLAGF